MPFDVFDVFGLSFDIKISCIRKLYKLLTLDSMELEREEIAHNLAHRRLHIRCQTKALSRALIMLYVYVILLLKSTFDFIQFFFQADMKRINRQIKYDSLILK